MSRSVCIYVHVWYRKFTLAHTLSQFVHPEIFTLITEPKFGNSHLIFNFFGNLFVYLFSVIVEIILSINSTLSWVIVHCHKHQNRNY